MIHKPRIIPAAGPRDLAAAKDLFVEYAASLPFSLCFQGFDAELASLPGRYAAPSGCILLADGGTDRGDNGKFVGCVAMCELEPTSTGRVCEMKRLYVQPAARGTGLSRRLCEELILRAREVGYERMKLDTSSDMLPAQSLYKSLGFRACERYNDDPMEDTLYFELLLR